MQRQITREDKISYTDQLVSLLREIIRKTPDVRAVCVGVPGAVSDYGEVFAIPQIPEWEQFLADQANYRRQHRMMLDSRMKSEATRAGIEYAKSVSPDKDDD